MTFDPIVDAMAILGFLGMIVSWIWGMAKMKASLDTNTAATNDATAGLKEVRDDLASFGERLSNLEGLFKAWTGLS